MIDLDGYDNNMTNIILATIRGADEQCNDFRKAGRSRELWANIRHAEKRMVKAMQRDLSGDRDLQLIERY